MDAYLNRVKQCAEEMNAALVNAKELGARVIPNEASFELLARLSVAREAESYYAGYMSNCPRDTVKQEKLWQSNCGFEMEVIGLIPPQTQTT